MRVATSAFSQVLLSQNQSIPTTSSSTCSSVLPLSSSLQSSPPLLSSSRGTIPTHLVIDDSQQQQRKTLLAETFHRNSSLRALVRELSREGSNPLRLLQRDGDWTTDQLWAAVSVLVDAGRANEAIQVFDCWRSKVITRSNEAHYLRIIRLLCERSLMIEANSIFQNMEKYGLVPTLSIYNAIIHGFAQEKKFDDAIVTMKKMVEANIRPKPETYNGIIRAYGNYQMYDDMSKCVKRMELHGCFPDEVTYNILITELAQGGLVKRMEKVFRTLLSKNMNLQPSTLVSMLEAYTDLEIFEKMEKVYHQVFKTKAFLKESLIRKLATVYIKNHRLSCLEDLGNDISATVGRTDLVWCILLLSSACCFSRRGVESIIREMEVAKVQFTITFVNILALFYMKMKDFRELHAIFLQARRENLKPDIVTVGILFDAWKVGYDGTHVLEEWTTSGLLQEVAQMKTDKLVLTAFGKGFFLMNCEKLYSSLEPKAKKRKLWRYSDLIGLVFGELKATKQSGVQRM
ncbi:pentatricopeptide repeat-containing protein At4g14190, chloroplastic [Typha latifolia]|uniref:pentatricopeptide repeat-containing protein At4g14190, chloroplastic n=1 Tax=Typha latifolia TaxID=4733 RepID=UPI003C2C5793